jgi:hypothetical protein
MAYPTFYEHEDSPEEGGNRSGELSFVRIFLCDWDDRWAFIAEHFRSGPFGYPASYSSYWPGVLADDFRITRILNKPENATITDPNTQTLTHDTLAMIRVTYTPLPIREQEEEQPPGQGPQLPDGTWATYNQDSTVEFATVLGRTCIWQTDKVALPPDINPVQPNSITEHQVTWHQVRRVPWITLGDMKGCVNLTNCVLPGSPQVFRPGTLLFNGLSDEITLNLNEQQPTRKLTLKFTEKAQKAFATSPGGAANQSVATVYGWNYQIRPDTNVYDQVIAYDTLKPLFATYEFNNLWTATT